ncbi:MAG: hypothetical protein JXA97_05170 [Anaerolineales bacterium]|nr:hypothetical protein [Anaerolineales bacterium]
MRMMHRSTLAAGIFLCLRMSSAAAQAPGYANIEAPRRTQVISGLVTIAGSASHPSFEAYELSFALSTDQSGTWFLIGESMSTAVANGNLGVWDTTGLSDGFYQLRLQVFLENGAVLESMVDNLQIRNYSAAIQATVSAGSPITALPTASPQPTLTLAAPVQPVRETPPTARVLGALSLGAALGATGLLGLGVLFSLRKDLGQRRHQVRMRQLLRQKPGEDNE